MAAGARMVFSALELEPDGAGGSRSLRRQIIVPVYPCPFGEDSDILSLLPCRHPARAIGKFDAGVTSANIVGVSPLLIELPILQGGQSLGVPQQIICIAAQIVADDVRCCLEGNQRNEVLTPQHFIHQGADEVDVLFTDLDEDTAAL